MAEYARLVVAVDSTQVKRSTDDMRRFSGESRSAERSVSSLGGTVRMVASAFGAFKLSQEIGEIATLASRYQQLGMVMETVGGNVGRSREELDDLEQQLKDTGISALESRSNIVKMISANIDLSKATELARLAQDAAVVANVNSSEAFARLIKGIQSAEKETLETMGLNVNFAQSYARLAAQLGKNADQLTAAEKVQAGVNAAMEAGANIAGSYEASMENALKQWQSSTRHLQDFKVALGASLATEFGSGVENYSDLLKFLGENVESVSIALRVGLYAAAGRAAVAIGQAAIASRTSSAASRAQAAEELRLAQAQAATTAATLQRYGTTWQLTRSTQGLTGAIVAHEAAERRLVVAQAASAGIGRTLLGVMGGPVGLAVTAGMVALSFMDWSGAADEVKRSAVDLSGPLDNLAERWRALGDSQRVVLQNDLRSSIRDTQSEVQAAVRSVETAFYARGNADDLPFNQWIAPLKEFRAEADRGGQSIHIASQILLDGVGAQSEFRTAVEQAAAKIEEQNQQASKARDGLKILEEQTSRNVSANNALAASTDTVGLTFVERLKRQADFAGDLTETQKVMISIEKGYAGTLSETDQQAALTYAGIIDRAAEATKATKGLTKSTKDLAGDYKTAVATMAREIAQHGKVGEVARTRYEIESGALKGVAAQQADYLLGLAAELDAKRDLTEQERLRIQLLRESGQLRAANDGQFQLEYAAKIAEYEKQGNQEALQRLETLKRIREIQMNADQAPGTVEGVTRAPQSQGVDAMFGGATGELIRLQDQSAELEAWRQSELEKQQGFLETKAINEEVYAERVRNIHQQHQAELSSLEQARTQVSLAATEQLFGSLTSMAGTFAGEQSGIYRAMFAVQKAAAIAQSIIAIQQGIAMAAANPWPANLGAMASVAAATAGIVSSIASVQSFEGGGYTGNGPRVGGLDGKGGFMAMVHPKETITDHTKQKGGGGGGAPVININAPFTVEAQPGTSPEDAQQYGRGVAGAMVATTLSTIEKESRPGGLLWRLYGGGR